MTLTVHEFIELIEYLFGWKHKHRRRKKPPAAVRNLTGVVNRGETMATVTLNWDLPATRVDATPLAPADIALVDVFDLSDADPSNPKIGTVNGPFTVTATAFTTGVLTVGNHSFTVVVQDTMGHRSNPSNAFSAVIAAVLADPSPVSNLTGTVNA